MIGLTKISFGGKEYPCRETMGAALRFKRETGRDISASTLDLEALITYLWCMVASACAQDGKPFDMSLMEFADAVPLDTLTEAMSDVKAEGSKKK